MIVKMIRKIAKMSEKAWSMPNKDGYLTPLIIFDFHQTLSEFISGLVLNNWIGAKLIAWN